MFSFLSLLCVGCPELLCATCGGLFLWSNFSLFLVVCEEVFLLSFLLARVGEESVLSCVDWGKVSLLGEEEGVGVEVGVGEAARR